jgi:DNA modification methylase
MIYNGDAYAELQKIDDDCVDAVITDPPYGYSFMNKDWDKAVIGVETWSECLRVLKPGAFAAIMSSPRQDVMSRMIVNLQDAGFRTDFTSIYWTYASGFPKAANVSKLVDKRNAAVYNPCIKQYLNENRKGLSFNDINTYLGTATTGGGTASAYMGDKRFNEIPTVEHYKKLKVLFGLDNRYDDLVKREEAEREIIGKGTAGLGKAPPWGVGGYDPDYNITKSATDKAKELDGSYAGFQPKPAVEVILMVMKPLSEKTYVDQALANGKGITWLDDCRIPFQDEKDIQGVKNGFIAGFSTDNSLEGWKREAHKDYNPTEPNNKGRFPANLLVEDDILNDGLVRKSGKMKANTSRSNLNGYTAPMPQQTLNETIGDSGSYSRYFDLDKWFETTFPFIITPKASSSEKSRGLDKWISPSKVNDGRKTEIDNPFQRGETLRVNTHPTVKPIKLMSYLISLLSREGDTILDPFCGSGTTLIAAKMLNRKGIGIELNSEYAEIADMRLKAYDE